MIQINKLWGNRSNFTELLEWGVLSLHQCIIPILIWRLKPRARLKHDSVFDQSGNYNESTVVLPSLILDRETRLTESGRNCLFLRQQFWSWDRWWMGVFTQLPKSPAIYNTYVYISFILVIEKSRVPCLSAASSLLDQIQICRQKCTIAARCTNKLISRPSSTMSLTGLWQTGRQGVVRRVGQQLCRSLCPS